MVFSSHVFIFYFLPIFLLIYYLLPFNFKGFYLRNTWITVASYIFYGWLEPWFVILMLLSTTWDYFCGKIITRPGQVQWKRKAALITAIVGDMALLVFFKYYMFTMENINQLLDVFGLGKDYLPIMQVMLPAGISFYTFVALSYTIDLYRGEAKPAKNLSVFSCFIGLFPHLIAGPIIRYQTVAEQLESRSHTFEKFASGVAIFCLGLGKKILLANPCGEIARTVFYADDPGTLNAWWGILAFHFQIYFDFCGYSDMAVGLARMIGIEFVKNFDGPYLSQNITTFWRKWHITLSSFIRDYLYIPLGGNRGGIKRTYFNLILAMFLCGLWHGAKMTFVVWGIYQALFMIFERLSGKKTFYAALPLFVQIFITNIIVMFGWVMFNSPSIDHAVMYWGSMLGAVKGSAGAMHLTSEIFQPRHIFVIILCIVVVFQGKQAHDWIMKLTPAKMIVCSIVFILAIIAMFTQTYNPFLYFQF
jgi:alginate O-acetyltransferase complex protein AlgI